MNANGRESIRAFFNLGERNDFDNTARRFFLYWRRFRNSSLNCR